MLRRVYVQGPRIFGAAAPGCFTSLNFVAEKSFSRIQSRSLFNKKEKKLSFADRVVVKMQKSFSKVPTKYKFIAGALFVVTFPGWIMWGLMEFLSEKIENVFDKNKNK